MLILKVELKENFLNITYSFNRLIYKISSIIDCKEDVIISINELIYELENNIL